MTIHPDHKNHEILGGYLMASKNPITSSGWGDFVESSGCELVSKLASPGWFTYIFKSNRPLLNEPPDIPPPYEYVVVLRASGDKALLISPTKRIINYLLNEVIASDIIKYFYKVTIDVNSIVGYISEHPDIYLLSYVHGRVQAFGDALRGISFYGKDLARAKLFRDQIDMMTAYTCGIRNLQTRKEIVRLSSDGSISFNFSKAHSGKLVEDVLAYVSNLGFLKG